MNDYFPSENLISNIRSFEGLRLKAYHDVAGFMTIGYGHKVFDPHALPEIITVEMADEMLLADATTAGEHVKRIVTVPMNQSQYDGLTDFAFNLGGNALAASTLLKRVNESNWTEACKEIIRWVHAAGVVLPGLVRRRLWEKSMLEQSK